MTGIFLVFISYRLGSTRKEMAIKSFPNRISFGQERISAGPKKGKSILKELRKSFKVLAIKEKD